MILVSILIACDGPGCNDGKPSAFGAMMPLELVAEPARARKALRLPPGWSRSLVTALRGPEARVLCPKCAGAGRVALAPA